jgi:hypothetical protein
MPDLIDICENRHRGAETSVAANKLASRSKAYWRGRIFNLIREAGQNGLTAKEAAGALGKPLNCISGRFSELAKDALIFKCGRRDGAAVWFLRAV